MIEDTCSQPEQRRHNQGVALISVLLSMALVLACLGLLATRSMQQIQSSGDSMKMSAATLASYSGQNMVTKALKGTIRNDLTQAVMTTSHSTSRWSYGTGTGTVPDAATVDTDLAIVKTRLQGFADTAFCSGTPTFVDKATINIRVHFTATACGQAIPSNISLPPGRFVEGAPRNGTGSVANQTYSLPYLVVVTGNKGKSKRLTTLLGEYQFQVGRSSFARFGLFTNVHQSAAGSDVVFTNNILYDGPVHTNGKFYFSTGTPYFGSYVTSAGCNNSTCTTQTPSVKIPSGTQAASVANTAFSGGTNSSNCVQYQVCPELVKGIDFNASYIPMPTNSSNQQAAAQADGIYYAESRTLKMWAADANGAAPATGVAATAQYIQTCKTSNTAVCETWRITMVNGQMVKQKNTSTTTTWGTATNSWAAATSFNGVVYATAFSRLGGPDRTGTTPATAPAALASFAQITVASDGNIRINRDLKYEDTPCSGSLARAANGTIQTATCNNLGADNILGIYSQNGSVSVASQSSCVSSTSCTATQKLDHAPNDVTIQGVVMSSTGEFNVESYNSGLDRGAINLLGGVIENYYGPVGTTGGTGFKRSFTYDQRLLQGMSPPYFPTTPNDEVTAVFTKGYGIKEQ
ncbi:DUF4900 domain-containing protein [Deinococcus roseus]|uniref:DUF4900 domain-containing protein n=1 Tax=Deinococcus roseus TaxID=392414 RepID=A0ABQ2DGU2_9DEIO|nr:DUF4900 domain-containing protein [Deinococcus roseus]GGJ56759.1 DUF4900 domain-containing protein [Deinococcus roseus]